MKTVKIRVARLVCYILVTILFHVLAATKSQAQSTNCALIMSCPSNIVVTSCFNVQEFYNPTASNICCGVNSTVYCTPPSGSIFTVGTTTTVTCTATDCAQNTNFCTFTVTVVPGTNCATNYLEIQCPSNIVVTSCTNTAVFYAPTVTDLNCTNWTVTCVPPSGSYFAVGTTNLVDCYVTDYCGESNDCSFTVTVLAGTNCPTNCITVTCPSNIVVTTCTNCADAYFSVSATNTCCFDHVMVRCTPASGDCFPIGTNLVQVTAYDPDCVSTPPVLTNFTVTVVPAANCCTNPQCCGPGLGPETIQWLQLPTNNSTLVPNPTGANAGGTWIITNLPGYGNVLVTQDPVTNVEALFTKDTPFDNVPNNLGEFNFTMAGYGPYSWGTLPGWLDLYYHIVGKVPDYKVNFYFLDGSPNPCNLVLAVIAVAEYTTNLVSQPVTFRSEYDLTNSFGQIISAYTALGSTYGLPLIPGVSGRVVDSAYSIDGFMGDSFNTGFALFQPDAALLTTNLPPGSGMDVNNNPYPVLTNSVPYVTFTISHQAGDSFGLTVGYIYCTNCSTNCLQVQCPTNKTIPCGVTNWSFDLPTATSCCTNEFYNSTGPGTNVLITSLGITTNDQCPQAVIYTESWLITDGCGDTNLCSQSVSVLCCSTNCLQVQCPTNITVPCGTTNWSFDPPTASTCCTNTMSSGTGYLTNLLIIPTTTVTNAGCPKTITQSWLIEDACGNTNTCSQTVTFQDNLPPTINCPSNIVISVTNCSTSVPVCYTPTATDPCSGTNLPVTCSPPSCSYFMPGTTTTVTCVATNCSGLTNGCNFTVTVTCCPNPNCCGPNQGPQTINWLPYPPTNAPALIPDPSGNNAAGTWFLTNLPCYGNVLVTQTCPDPTNNILWFLNPNLENVTNAYGSFEDVQAGYGPYSWGSFASELNFFNDTTTPISYNVNFYFLDGAPNPCTLYLGVIGLAAGTTATVSQPVTFRAEYDLDSNAPGGNGYASANTTLNGLYGLSVAGSSGTIVGSAYSSNHVGDPVNTGWAVLQPTNSLLTANLPTGSGAGWPGPLSNVPCLTLAVDQQPGDGIAFNVGYVCCTNCNCLQVQCPTNKTYPCGTTNWSFDTPTATSCCTNEFYNPALPPTNVLITSLGITTNDLCPQAMVYTQTWLIADGCGSSNTCSQSVSVQCCQTNTGCIDLICPGNIVATTCSNCVPVFFSTTATDCCSNVASITYNPPSGSCFGLGTTLVQVSASACGFITNCTFTVTVTQGTNGGTNCLLVQCPTNQVVKCGSNWHFDPPTATSCCSNEFSTGTGSLTNVLITSLGFVTNGSCPQLSITESWLITDGCCDSTTCTQTVTVVGSLPPMLNCPSNIVVTSCTNAEIFYTPTAIDPCSGSNLLVTCNPPSGAFFSPGTTNTVTCTATNCDGTNSCSFTVTVLLSDNCCAGSNLVCNGSFDQPSIGNNTYQFVTNLPCWTTTDSLGDFEIWSGTFDGITSYPSNQSIEINAQDSYETVSQVVTGLNTNCEATFCFWYTGRQGLVNGTYNNDFTVSLTPNVGPAYFSEALDPPIFSSIPSPGWLEFCTNFVPTTPTLTISFLGDPHSPYPEGAHIDDVTLTQCCTNSCLSVDCPSNMMVPCGSVWAFGQPTATSCCMSNFTGTKTNVLITVVSTVTNGICPQVITRTWLIADACGNTKSCSQTFTVVDTTAPIINCPSNTIVETLNSNCQLVIPAIHVTATDNCTPVCDLVYSQSPPAGTIVPGPNATVTITVTDLCGNSSSCTVLVEGVARSGLIVNWPASVTATNCVVPCVFVTATDCACPLTAPRISQYPPCGTPVGPGINSVTVTVTDCNGAIQMKVIPLNVPGDESFLSSLTNTGISLTGTLLAPSAVDPHYTMSMAPLVPPPGYTAPDAVVVDNLWGWLEIPHVSQWIAPTTYFPPNYDLTDCQGGIYTYTNKFTLPAGANPATASISGRWAADNEAVAMNINGHATGNTISVPLGLGFASWTPFTISSGFVSGQNTIVFVVTNQGESPTGLRVEFTNATLCTTCAPPSIISTTSAQSLQAGSTATLAVKAGGTPPFTYQWQFNNADIEGATNSTLQIKNVSYTNAGLYTVSIANPCGGGSGTGGNGSGGLTGTVGQIPLQVTAPLPWPNASWNVADLTNPLGATYGPDLILTGTGIGTNFALSVGTSEDFGLPDPGGQIVNVMDINPADGATIAVPVIAASGSTSDNSYSLIMDIYEPDESLGTPSTLFSSIACCVSNLSSGGQDGVGLTLDASNYVHITGSSAGVPFDAPSAVPMAVDAWNRVALVVDAPQNGIGGSLSAYINGQIAINPCTCCVLAFTNINWTVGTPTVLSAPTDGVSSNAEFYVSSIQFHAAALTPQMIAGIGSPVTGPPPVNQTLAGQPPLLSAVLSNGVVNISWTGSPYALQETTDLTSGEWENSVLPFTESSGKSGNLVTTAVATPTPSAPTKFYRLIFSP